MKFHITKNLPPGLISIEEITDTKEEVILPSRQEYLDLRQSESIYYYSPFKKDTCYSQLTEFLHNTALNYSPPRIPFYAIPRGNYRPSLNMSGDSSMFSASPETYFYGGSSIPAGYQLLFGRL